MPRSVFKGITIKSIAAAVPTNAVDNLTHHTFLPEKDRKNIIALTGVDGYRKALPETCSSDLCLRAAEKLMADGSTEPDSIDAVIFVSMTPDFRIPSTACILQDKLGCPSSTVAFDVNMGCSGYIVGLFIACTMIQGAGLRRVLLLAGDTQSKMCHPEDKNVVFLFGDGGTATLLDASETAADAVTMELFTDGSRFQKLFIPAGGYRRPSDERTRQVKTMDDGGIRSEEDVYMDGMEIFKFSSTDVVRSIQRFMETSGTSPEDYDYLVLHQANKFMTDKIARKLKFPAEKVPYSMQTFGNTGSASIPLTIVHHRNGNSFSGKKRYLLSGFGVGLSWGIVDVCLGEIECPPMVEV